MGKGITDKQWQSGEMVEHPNLQVLLEQRAASSVTMKGFILAKADLSRIDLVNKNAQTGFQLVNGDFYRTNFTHAHCFKLDFSGSSLMKADFSFSNLHCANLSDCNLLGANFNDAKLENVTWGNQVYQHKQAIEGGNSKETSNYYEQAEEVYPNLRMVTEKQGLFEQSGLFFPQEITMRRKQMPLFCEQMYFKICRFILRLW